MVIRLALIATLTFIKFTINVGIISMMSFMKLLSWANISFYEDLAAASCLSLMLSSSNDAGNQVPLPVHGFPAILDLKHIATSLQRL